MLIAALGLAGALLQTPAAIDKAAVAGRVVEQDTQAPIAGAQVMLAVLLEGPPAAPFNMRPMMATTDADGRFTFDGVDPGRYRVSATRAGFASAPLSTPPIDSRRRSPARRSGRADAAGRCHRGPHPRRLGRAGGRNAGDGTSQGAAAGGRPDCCGATAGGHADVHRRPVRRQRRRPDQRSRRIQGAQPRSGRVPPAGAADDHAGRSVCRCAGRHADRRAHVLPWYA